MNQQQLIEALTIIAEEQRNTAPVEIRIAAKDEIQRGELYLIECSHHVIDALLDQGYAVEATKFDGAHVMRPVPAGFDAA